MAKLLPFMDYEVHCEHGHHAEAAAFREACAGPQPRPCGAPGLESSGHAEERFAPASDELSMDPYVREHFKDWKAWEAVEGFNDVGRCTGQWAPIQGGFF